MTNRNPLIFSTLFFIISLFTFDVYAQNIILTDNNKPSNIRGLSVVDDKTAWISGSKGYIATTNDGGKTWIWEQVKGHEKSDFRDIEAFSDKEAVIMSSGTPALVLKTTNGGKTWEEKYHKTDSAFFFDAMDFINNQRGYILGDPINSKFFLLETKDGGETWTKVSNLPDALTGEACFAASGTCLRISSKNLFIVSGGKNSRMITFSIYNNIWSYADLPIIHNKASQGAFSIAIGRRQGIIVGGDYENDRKTDSIAATYPIRSFPFFNIPQKGPSGFQSCVEHIKGDVFLSTGTSGSNITHDGGKTWTKIDEASFNVCSKAKRGKLVLLAGNGGKIAIFKM